MLMYLVDFCSKEVQVNREDNALDLASNKTIFKKRFDCFNKTQHQYFIVINTYPYLKLLFATQKFKYID